MTVRVHGGQKLPVRVSRTPHFLAAIIALLSLAILLGQCSLTLLGPPQSFRLTENESGDTLYLKGGDALEIALPANPTTGYAWEVVRVETDLLAADGEPGFTPDSDLVGAGGLMVFRFKAIGAGQGTLQLIYRRPFEQGVAPIKTFSATIVVH